MTVSSIPENLFEVPEPTLPPVTPTPTARVEAPVAAASHPWDDELPASDNTQPTRRRPRRTAAEILAEERTRALAENRDARLLQTLHGLFPNAHVHPRGSVQSSATFRAVWRANLTRAQASDQLALAVTATQLLRALDDLGPDRIVSAEVTMGDEQHAVWFDAQTGAFLATATPASTYLAGS